VLLSNRDTKRGRFYTSSTPIFNITRKTKSRYSNRFCRLRSYLHRKIVYDDTNSRVCRLLPFLLDCNRESAESESTALVTLVALARNEDGDSKLMKM
jgi:hypothetical protein